MHCHALYILFSSLALHWKCFHLNNSETHTKWFYFLDLRLLTFYQRLLHLYHSFSPNLINFSIQIKLERDDLQVCDVLTTKVVTRVLFLKEAPGLKIRCICCFAAVEVICLSWRKKYCGAILHKYKCGEHTNTGLDYEYKYRGWIQIQIRMEETDFSS